MAHMAPATVCHEGGRDDGSAGGAGGAGDVFGVWRAGVCGRLRGRLGEGWTNSGWKANRTEAIGVDLSGLVSALEEADRFPLEHADKVCPSPAASHSHFLYQRLRYRLFRDLLRRLPRTRPQLIREATHDIPTLLRPQVWAALLGLPPGAGCQTALACEEVYLDRLSTMPLPKELPSVDFDIAKCHGYRPLLATAEGRSRVERLLKGCFQESPQLAYLRGLESVASPLVVLFYHEQHIAFACLRAILRNFLENFFLKDQCAHLRGYLYLFNSLLFFLDPQLALHLQTIGLHPDLYSLSWFLTLFSHLLPLKQLLPLWDTLFVQPPSLTVFIAATLLHTLRTHLLAIDDVSCALSLLSSSPSLIDIADIAATALRLHNSTPVSLSVLLTPKKAQTPNNALAPAPAAATEGDGALLAKKEEQAAAAHEGVSFFIGDEETSSNSASGSDGESFGSPRSLSRSPSAAVSAKTRPRRGRTQRRSPSDPADFYEDENTHSSQPVERWWEDDAFDPMMASAAPRTVAPFRSPTDLPVDFSRPSVARLSIDDLVDVANQQQDGHEADTKGGKGRKGGRVIVLDARPKRMFAKGHFNGSHSVPVPRHLPLTDIFPPTSDGHPHPLLTPPNSPPWLNNKQQTEPMVLDLVVIVGDRRESGRGLAERLFQWGVRHVTALTGGMDAVSVDAPLYVIRS